MEWRVLIFTVLLTGCIWDAPLCSSTVTIEADPPVAIHDFHVIVTCTVTHEQDTLPGPITITSPQRGLCVTMDTDGGCIRANTTCGSGVILPWVSFTCRDRDGTAVVTMVNEVIDNYDYGTYNCSHENEMNTTTVSNVAINETTFYSSRPSDNQVNIFCSFRRDGDGTVPALMISPPWREGDPSDDTYQCLSFAGDDNCHLHDQCNDTRYSVLSGDINNGCDYRTGGPNPLAVLILIIQNPDEQDYGDWKCFVNDNFEQELTIETSAPGDVEFSADIPSFLPMDIVTMACVYSHAAKSIDYALSIIHPYDGSVCIRKAMKGVCEPFPNCTFANIIGDLCQDQPFQVKMGIQIVNTTARDAGQWKCRYDGLNSPTALLTLHALETITAEGKRPAPEISVGITDIGTFVSCAYQAWPAPNVIALGAEFPMLTTLTETVILDGRVESKISIMWDPTSDEDYRKTVNGTLISCRGHDRDGQMKSDNFTIHVQFPGEDGPSAGMIVGAVVGGLLLLAAIVIVVVVILRRQRNTDSESKAPQAQDNLGYVQDEHSQEEDGAQLNTEDGNGSSEIDETIVHYGEAGIREIDVSRYTHDTIGNERKPSAAVDDEDDDDTSGYSQGDASTEDDDDEVVDIEDPSQLYAKVDKGKKKKVPTATLH